MSRNRHTEKRSLQSRPLRQTWTVDDSPPPTKEPRPSDPNPYDKSTQPSDEPTNHPFLPRQTCKVRRSHLLTEIGSWATTSPSPFPSPYTTVTSQHTAPPESNHAPRALSATNSNDNDNGGEFEDYLADIHAQTPSRIQAQAWSQARTSMSATSTTGSSTQQKQRHHPIQTQPIWNWHTDAGSPAMERFLAQAVEEEPWSALMLKYGDCTEQAEVREGECTT